MVNNSDEFELDRFEQEKIADANSLNIDKEKFIYDLKFGGLGKEMKNFDNYMWKPSKYKIMIRKIKKVLWGL